MPWLLLLLFALLLTPTKTQSPCPLDVIFVIDGSESVTDFSSIVKPLINDLSDRLLRFDGVRVAALEYSDGVTVVTTQGFTTNAAEFRQLINAMNQSGGTTFTATALNASLDLSDQFGDPDAVPVLFLLTDGFTSRQDGLNIESVVARLDATLAHRVVVGVGKQADLKLNENIRFAGAFGQTLMDETYTGIQTRVLELENNVLLGCGTYAV